MDPFTSWRDRIELPSPGAEEVALALNKRVFCYFGVPEIIYIDQDVEYQDELNRTLCQLWDADCTGGQVQPAHDGGTIEGDAGVWGESAQELLLNRDPTNWDLLLPQVMRAIRSAAPGKDEETANALMLGREVQLPQALKNPMSTDDQSINE